MKIVYPMQLGGANTPTDVASLEEFISKLNSEPAGHFLLGSNRIWHGGVHLSDGGPWHPSGAVRAIADGEMVAYRLASKPAVASLQPDGGLPGTGISLRTSPSFCLIRHHYEATEEVAGQQPKRNAFPFYSLYMHLACDEHYSGEGAARWVVKGDGVMTYEPVLARVSAQQYQLTTRCDAQNRTVYAKKGAEVILSTASPSQYLNARNEPHDYYLVHYADGPSDFFYIAASQLQAQWPAKPQWMNPPASKPVRRGVARNSWLRRDPNNTEHSWGLPRGSEVVVSGEQAQGSVSGGLDTFYKVEVFACAAGKVKDSANQVMSNASKGTVGWILGNRLGETLAAETYLAIELEKIVDRGEKPIKVTAGELIGHWGEHETAQPAPTASGFGMNSDKKALHLEVLVASKDKAALQACINNEGRLTGGQGYLVLKAGESVTRYRLSKQNNQASYHDIGTYGPQPTPLAVADKDVIKHGANNFVKVAERAAASSDELAGEYVLLGGDVELVSQHDWAKLGVRLVDGSSDPDGFLDKADTDGQEGGEFFSKLYGQVTADSDGDGTVSSSEIRAALADENVASQIRKQFICHESEWIKRPSWPRLEQELKGKPNLYKYALTVNENMSWIDDSAIQGILGDSKPWFIHPAGMMGLVVDKKKLHVGCACNRDLTLDELKALKPAASISDEKLQSYLDTFNKSFDDFSVKTCVEKAHFLAQVFHESGALYYTKEEGGSLQSYSPWYGRGFIQITFRENYEAYGEYVNEDVTSSAIHRDKLTVSPHVVKSAYWYIYVGRSACRTAFANDDLLYGSVLINGGLTHYIDRKMYINRALKKFGDPDEFIRNENGEYDFSKSEIYKMRRGALAWGIWNDIGTHKAGVNNNPAESLKGYKRFLVLLEEQPFTLAEGNKKWYGRLCNTWKAYVEQRISLLE